MPRDSTILGVDPGKTGALVVMVNQEVLFSSRMPLVKTTRNIDYGFLSQVFKTYQPHFVFQEFVRSRPGNGVKQCFEFGRAAEACRAVAGVYNVDFYEVLPKKWQLLVEGLNRDSLKESIVIDAKKKWPNLKIHHKADWGVADAAFIALHGCLVTDRP
jgi:hypothetical protein